MKTFLTYLNYSVLAGLLIMAVVVLAGCNGNMAKDVHDLQTSQDNQDSELQAQQVQLDTLESQLEALTHVVAQNEQEVDVLQAQVHIIQQQIAVLQGYKNIVAILDPCGDSTGIVDEVLLKLSSGQVIASYSDNFSGKNTHFGVLSNGVNYITTDGSNCLFHLVNGNLAY